MYNKCSCCWCCQLVVMAVCLMRRRFKYPCFIFLPEKEKIKLKTLFWGQEKKVRLFSQGSSFHLVPRGWRCHAFLWVGKQRREALAMMDSGHGTFVLLSWSPTVIPSLGTAQTLNTKKIKKIPLLLRSSHPSWWEKQNHNTHISTS